MKIIADYRLYLCASLLTLLFSCQEKEKPATNQERLLEDAGDTELSFVLSSFGAAFDEIVPPVRAVCGKASGQRCNLNDAFSGTSSMAVPISTSQLIEYAPACGFGEYSVTGSVRISTNRSDCLPPDASGEVLVISQNITLKRAQTNFSIDYSSSLRSSGPSTGVGGGYSLTHGGRAGMYHLRVGGFHKVIRDERDTLSDRTLTSTSTPLLLQTRNFDRRNRVVNSGSVLATNNIDRSQTLYSFQNLTWNQESCCHPTGGALETVGIHGENRKSRITFSQNCGDFSGVDSEGLNFRGSLKHCGGSIY